MLLRFPEPLFFSTETESTETILSPDRSDIVIAGLSLTTTPAHRGLRPVTLLAGALDRYSRERSQHWRLKGVHKEVVDAAEETVRERSRGEPIRVTGGVFAGQRIPDDPVEQWAMLEELDEQQRPPGKLRLRRRVVR